MRRAGSVQGSIRGPAPAWDVGIPWRRIAHLTLAGAILMTPLVGPEAADRRAGRIPRRGGAGVSTTGVESALQGAYVPRARGVFIPPTAGEARRFRAAFEALLAAAQGPVRDPSGSPPPAPRDALAGMGLAVVSVTQGGDPYWLVLEADGRERGAGAYAIRLGPDAGPWHAPGKTRAPAARVPRGGAVVRAAIMVPHPRSDVHTEAIGPRLLIASRARAYLQSSAHRDTLAPDGTSCDVAHRSDSFFQVATEVLDAAWREGLFLQLHGFESKRPARRGLGSEVIVSTGGARPGPAGAAAESFLRGRHAGDFLGVWGRDTRLLGGTRNVQARWINAQRHNLFLHVEMSPAVRSGAVDDGAVDGGRSGSFFESLAWLVGRP